MKFFVDILPAGDEYTLTGENAKHIGISLRARVGEQLLLGDNSGNECICEIVGFSGGKESDVFVRVLSRQRSQTEPKVKVTLFQCLPKGDKLETVIQKAVELGANEIIPVQSENCVVKHDYKTAKKKNERYRKIAEEAAKQSRRGIIPEVYETVSFEKMQSMLKNYENRLFLYEKGGIPLREALEQKTQTIACVIGPEGGFSQREAELLGELCQTVTLGKRILRTETAPLCVLSAIMFEYGEME